MLPNLIELLYKGKSVLRCYLAWLTGLYRILECDIVLTAQGDQNIKGGRNGIRYASFKWDLYFDTRRFFCVLITLLGIVLCIIILRVGELIAQLSCRVVRFTYILLFKKWKSHLRLPTGFTTLYKKR